jgi:hypothetical protein
MNSVEFENDLSIIIKSHTLPLKRSKKEIKLILIFHITYEVIEIKIYENSSNNILGREILTYSDIFQIFNNYFICFNENMHKIFSYLNNCIYLRKCEIYINEVTKTINLEIFVLKDNGFDSKNIYITSIYDENKWNLISSKIKELNLLFNRYNNIIRVAPFINCIKYENNMYSLYFDISIEKDIDILTFKAILINRNNNIIINNNNKEQIFSAFYSKEDINYISKSYYESIPNISEISDDIKINIFNKNIKLENVTDDKIKLTVTVFSSINQYKIYFELIKGFDIKNKYIQMIKELRLRNEMLANNEILRNKKNLLLEQKNKNNNIKNKNNSTQKNSNNNDKKEKQKEKEKDKEKKIIGKKRKRAAVKSGVKKKEKEKENKNMKEENDEKESFLFNDSSCDNSNSIDSETNKVKNAIEKVINDMIINQGDSNKKQSYKKENKKRIKFIAPHNLKNLFNQKNKKDEPYVTLNNSLEVEKKE